MQEKQAKEWSIVLRFRDDTSPPITWYIRGLRGDGSFYGTLRAVFAAPRSSDGAHGVHRTIDGQLSDPEIARVRELTEVIRSQPIVEIRGEYLGVVGWGLISRAERIFQAGDENIDTPALEAFREIVQIMRPHIEAFYPLLI